MWWSGRETFERKRVSKNGPDGHRYKYSYKVKERAPEERIGVPVPDSCIPREGVDAAREAIKNNRRPPTPDTGSGSSPVGSCVAQSAAGP